jgi:hypothetical protein
MISLGVLLLSGATVSAEDSEDTNCAATAPIDLELPSIDKTPHMQIVGDSVESMQIASSSSGVIEIAVDCWHVGHCAVCDESLDYDCSPYGSYGGYMEANYGIDDGWEPCPFPDPIPSGNVVTRIEATVYGIFCPSYGGSGLTNVLINEQSVGLGTQAGTCACGTCNPLTITSVEYPDGFPGYVYGGTNQVALDIVGVTCFSDVHLKLYYSPAVTLEYEWIPPDPPEAKMGRNYMVQLQIYNPEDEPQTGSFSFTQDVFSTSEPFGWDEGWEESILLNASPYTEGSAVNAEVPALQTLEYSFTINNKWNWIEPYGAGRLVDIAFGIMLSWPGLEVASLSYSTVTTLFTYVDHVGQVGYRCTGVGDGDPTQFYVTLSVPYEKYVFYGESVLAGIAGGKLTSAGIAALFVPGAGWAVAGPLFALEAIEIATGEVAYALAVDPDMDYTEVVSPQPISVPAVDALDEGSGKKAALAALDALSYLDAVLASYAKYEGAEDADDTPWMVIQLELTKRYLEKAAESLSAASYLLESVLANVPVPSDENIEVLRNWIVDNGLPQIEVDVLAALGYSSGEIDAIEQAMANLPDNAFTLFPDSPEVFANMADGLGNGADALPSHPEGVALAIVDIHPDTLNRRSVGRRVTCYIELPGEYPISDIDVDSLTLQGVIHPESDPTEIGDYDSDGTPDLMVKFDRNEVIELLQPGEQSIALTGQLDGGTALAGVDTVRVIH